MREKYRTDSETSVVNSFTFRPMEIKRECRNENKEVRCNEKKNEYKIRRRRDTQFTLRPAFWYKAHNAKGRRC